MAKSDKLPVVSVDAQAVFCKDCHRPLGRIVSVDVPIALFCQPCGTWTSGDPRLPSPLALKPGEWRRT